MYCYHKINIMDDHSTCTFLGNIFVFHWCNVAVQNGDRARLCLFCSWDEQEEIRWWKADHWKFVQVWVFNHFFYFLQDKIIMKLCNLVHFFLKRILLCKSNLYTCTLFFFILRSRLELIEDTHKNKESRQVLINSWTFVLLYLWMRCWNHS